MTSRKERRRDANQLAKSIVDNATRAAENLEQRKSHH